MSVEVMSAGGSNRFWDRFSRFDPSGGCTSHSPRLIVMLTGLSDGRETARGKDGAQRLVAHSRPHAHQLFILALRSSARHLRD